MKAHLLHPRTLLKPDAAEGGKPAEKQAEKPPEKAPESKPAEKPSKEELQKRQQELKALTRGGRKAKVDEKPVEKQAEKPPEKTAEKPPEKTEEKPPEKAPEKKEEKVPETPRETVEVPPPIGRVGRESAPKTSDAAPELKTQMDLTQAEKRKLRVIQQMEKEQTVPKGHAEKVLKFWEREAKYIEDWERANPGKRFDENAEEHQAWYEQHEVTYSADDYEVARDNLVREDTRSERSEEQKKRDEAQKRSEEFRSAQPKLVSKANEAVIDMIAIAAPELAELMGSNGSRKLDADVHKAMTEKDPVVTEILQEAAEELAILQVELNRLMDFGDIYSADPAKTVVLNVAQRRFKPHDELLDFMSGLEREMVAMDPAKTMRGKRRLVSNSEFNAAVEGIMAGGGERSEKQRQIDALNERYYTLEVEDFSRGLTAAWADRAKREIEKFGKRHSLRTPKKKEEATEVAQEGGNQPGKDEAAKTEENPPAQRTRSPSTATASDVVDTKKAAAVTAEDDKRNALARSRGR